jgi:hypothetical protein
MLCRNVVLTLLGIIFVSLGSGKINSFEVETCQRSLIRPFNEPFINSSCGQQCSVRGLSNSFCLDALKDTDFVCSFD